MQAHSGQGRAASRARVWDLSLLPINLGRSLHGATGPDLPKWGHRAAPVPSASACRGLAGDRRAQVPSARLVLLATFCR